LVAGFDTTLDAIAFAAPERLLVIVVLLFFKVFTGKVLVELVYGSFFLVAKLTVDPNPPASLFVGMVVAG
jgi:hypothetical protein